jgi:hypothetical protein
MNIPLQGLAGDLMRLSLNNIRKWAIKDKGVENALRLHGSVHDEIDPSIKNEYCPYILPRLTRLMKLRELHKERNWTVPIETDIEYGQSWDIEFHMTGDKDHKPSGYWDVPGMQTYIPMEWVEEYPMLCELMSTPEGHAKVVKGLRKSLHDRVAIAIDLFEKTSVPAEQKQWLTIALQLDEYWRIDEGEDPYTLEEFEKFYGLTRPPLPMGGFIGSLPVEYVVDFWAKKAQEEVVVEPEEVVQETVVPELEIVPELPKSEPFSLPWEEESPKPVPTPVVEKTEDPEEEDDDLFLIPKKKPVSAPVPELVPAEVIPEAPKEECLNIPEDEVIIKVSYDQGVPVLRFMDDEDLELLMRSLGRGKKSLKVVYCGEIYELLNLGSTEIPKEFTFKMSQIERIERGDPSVEGFSLED